jgi:hypothetical protein
VPAWTKRCAKPWQKPKTNKQGKARQGSKRQIIEINQAKISPSSYHLGITKFACALWREGGFDVDVSTEGVTETQDHRKISMDCEGTTS